ncbi:DUF7319 domain-containing protein [Natronomonas sp. EA1]|uniref:DUF7319 domain-containing protein n=1 Tax=Natronomonas sp. EA1 TaxID=3421655 RepID=UPI003EB8EFDF
MADSRSEPATDDDEAEPSTEELREEAERELSTEELRKQVEEKYDFENFRPEDMERMTLEEWEAVFDPETWITGTELLDRLEADLKTRIRNRDVFARIERHENPERLVAYSDEGYAIVYGDGSVEGQGTVLRDVKPSVALCSMDDYDVPPMPEGDLLPKPMEVPEGSGEFGNLMLQIIAGMQVIAGLVLAGGALLTQELGLIAGVAGVGFLFIGVLLFTTVANARLSDTFRAEEYRNRLRAIGIDSDERPAFLPEFEAEGELTTEDE